MSEKYIHTNTTFYGVLKKVQIRSCECFFHKPFNEYTESEQHITMLSDGRVWISRYCIGDKNIDKLVSKKNYKIRSNGIENIFRSFNDIFKNQKMR